MKLLNTVLGITTAVLILSTSCKKDKNVDEPYKCATCATASNALPAYDASSKGVYKGIVIGSTGTISFNISNDGSTINAVMVLDGTSTTLTASVSWVDGVSYVSPFSGTLNGNPVVINFKVDADGQNPIITSSTIPGHPNAEFNLVKELSTTLLECFEGSYSSTRPETGTFNLLVSRSLGKFGGASRKSGDSTSDPVENGTIDSNGNLFMNGNAIGKLVGDVITGTFNDSNGSTITINANRTL